MSELYKRTPHFYGQFTLSLSKESPYIFSKLNHFNMGTPLIRTLPMAPSVPERGDGTPQMKGVGMLVGNFELNESI